METVNTWQLLVANDPFLRGINISAFDAYMKEINIEKNNENDICQIIDDDLNITIKKERAKNRLKCAYPNNINDIGCIIDYENL